METLQEIQETKKVIEEYHSEVAAVKEKEKLWWKFW
ncbi:TPA: DUF3967 domain-containing protein [Bacillus pseudomycoides]|nr:DUF3967 domain-containing protein [Bacillus pseudomycoides]